MNNITIIDKCKFDKIILESSLADIIKLFKSFPESSEDAKLIINTCLHYRIFSIMPEIVIRDHFYTTELLRLAPYSVFLKCNMQMFPECPKDYILALARNTVDFEQKIQWVKQEFIKARIDYISLMISMITDDTHRFRKIEYTKRMTNIFGAFMEPDERSIIINTLASRYSDIIKYCVKFLDIEEVMNVLKNAVHMNNYLSFAATLNQSSHMFRSGHIIELFYYVISFGSEQMAAKIQKVFGGNSLRNAFLEHKECNQILVKIAERGSIQMFEHITKYWTDLKHTYMSIDRMTSHASYNGHVEFLEYMRTNLIGESTADNFFGIILRKSIKSQNADSMLFVYRHRPELFLENSPTEFIKKNIINRNTMLTKLF